jgi:hypothetical protein
MFAGRRCVSGTQLGCALCVAEGDAFAEGEAEGAAAAAPGPSAACPCAPVLRAPPLVWFPDDVALDGATAPLGDGGGDGCMLPFATAAAIADAAPLLAVAEGEAAGTWLADGVGFGLEGAGDRERVPVALCVPLALPDAVTLLVGVKLCVGVPLRLPLWLRLPVRLGEAPTLPLAVPDPEAVSVGVPLWLPVDEPDAPTVWLAVGVPVAVAEPVPVPVVVAVCDGMGSSAVSRKPPSLFGNGDASPSASAGRLCTRLWGCARGA